MPHRTKSKKTHNGYRSEFIGLDLTVRIDDETTIVLPVETQIQTIQQYRDGNSGFSAHTKLAKKGMKLKNIPTTGDSSRYKEDIGYYREYLSHIMHTAPSCAIARNAGNDRVVIIPSDIYESFRLISNVPEDSPAYKSYIKYFKELYSRRDEILPSGDVLLPKYIRRDEIPSSNTKYFSRLRLSVKETMEQTLGSKYEQEH